MKTEAFIKARFAIQKTNSMLDKVLEKCTIMLTITMMSIMKGNGSIILSMAKVGIILAMVMSMRVCLGRTNIMAKEK